MKVLGMFICVLVMQIKSLFSVPHTHLFLSVVNQAKPFDTVDQLEEQTNYIIGAQDGTTFQNMFIVSSKYSDIF